MKTVDELEKEITLLHKKNDLLTQAIHQGRTIKLKFNESAKLLKKKDKQLKELNDSLEKQVFDKTAQINHLFKSFDEHVIASETDTKGIITYASDAFCKVSGYTQEELIGKPHNIVRHPDMKKEMFSKMWKTIQSGKKWYGEVKNLKKDTGFYWVKAVISPIYDEERNIIKYSAIREDITDKKEIEHLQQEIEDTQREVIFTMGSIGETRSKETGLHVKRVAEYSKLFALLYGLDAKEAELLKEASPMHDIGKVGIPDSILHKAGLLTQDERILMNTHAELGFEMLKKSNRVLLKTAAIVAYQHHEYWDGNGYPNGVKGEDIHIFGRITALADVFDALGSDRCYKIAWDDEKIFKLFRDERGKQFDPKLIDIFFDNLDSFLKIRDSMKDIFS